MQCDRVEAEGGLEAYGAYTLGELGAVDTTLRKLGGVSVAAAPAQGLWSRRAMLLLISLRDRRARAIEGMAGGGRRVSWCWWFAWGSLALPAGSDTGACVVAPGAAAAAAAVPVTAAPLPLLPLLVLGCDVTAARSGDSEALLPFMTASLARADCFAWLRP
jgi:hypothetical protein